MKRWITLVAAGTLLMGMVMGCASGRTSTPAAPVSGADAASPSAEDTTTTPDPKSFDLIHEAVVRAEATGRLAGGRIRYEVILSDASIPFAYHKGSLSDGVRTALDIFARRFIPAPDAVYIEIQGHTDAIGSEAYNQALGRERAESVRRYLNVKHRLPIQRMNAFSYGETQPVADNESPAGRAKNRRVVLLVME
jgi:peptidoglycan-associated lipoprotein